MATASIIVPTRNEEGVIRDLLESIFSQEFHGDIEVLIMDSSDDRTAEIAREFPVKLARVEPEDYNHGKTRNEGASVTKGDFLIFLSADVKIRDERWLSKLVSHFSDPEVAGVYGRQLPLEGAAPMGQFFILQTYPAESAVLSFGGSKVKTEGMVFFSNANSAIRRSVWQHIKLPEMLRSEDLEWAKRALLAGHKIIYDADAAVYHTNSYSLKSVFQVYFDAGTAMPVISREQITDHSFRRFVRDGLGFAFNEYKFLIRNGHWRWIPYVTVYDIAIFLGAFLGSKQKYMPLWMKRALCMKKNHWDTYSDVIREPA